MAIKNERPIWLNSDFNLEKEFNEESFEKLIEYSKNNELNLMSIWLNGTQRDTRRTLQLGTALLNYFEHTISEDSKSLAVFKLGSLFGHLECLNRISYETDQNNLAKAKFEVIRLMHPEYSDYFENILTILLKENKAVSENELFNKIQFGEQEAKIILIVLLKNGFINFYEFRGYSLSDMGIRLAMQLTETIKK